MGVGIFLLGDLLRAARSWVPASPPVKRFENVTPDTLTRAAAVRMMARMSWRPQLSLALAAALSVNGAAAAVREVLDQIVATYEHHPFRLAVDLHVPLGLGQPAPSLDLKGWHHNEPSRPVLLGAGEAVEVTAVFNYGDKGVFLEISRFEKEKGSDLPPHLRVRFIAEAPPEKPDVQATELVTLISRVLRPPAP